jgi:malonyl-CoA O-methyltransferase
VRLFNVLKEGWSKRGRGQTADGVSPVQKAIAWVKNHRIPGGGILPHHKHTVATQEVTGYLIPSLYNVGERELAKDLARWEALVQRSDGAFEAPDGGPYTFDTAQVVRGFLAVLDELPELEPNLRRACDYVERHITQEGKVTTASYASWECSDGSRFSEYTNLYVLPPLIEASKKLSSPRYREAAFRALHYFKRKSDLVEFKSEIGTLSHIFGYMMEALVDLGEFELAQLALAWYKLGDVEPADRAVNYLLTIQNPSGGFYGSYGPNGQFFPKEEISWAVKFFLDCLLMKNNKA